jgi:hypothetical protein
VLIAVTEGEHLRVLAAPVEGGRVELSVEPSVALTLSLIALNAPLDALGLAPGAVAPAPADACESAAVPSTDALYYSAELAEGTVGAWWR